MGRSPIDLWATNSVTDIATCVSLCPSVTVGQHLAYRGKIINIMRHDKYLADFFTPKHFGQFRTTFLVNIGYRIGQNLRNVRILHLQLASVTPRWLRH